MKKIKKQSILIILTLTFALLVCSAVSAEDTVSGYPYVSNDIYVSPTGNDSNSGADVDHPVQTIQTGLNLVNNTGTIHLANGIYNKDINDSSKDFGITLDKSVTILGSGKDSTILDASWSRFFTVPYGYTLILQDLTLKNGRDFPVGSAIINRGTLTAKNCAFINNGAGESGFGGAIYNELNSNCALTNCVFINNTAMGGGAIYNSGTLRVIDCTFTGNKAENTGGAIDNGGILTITGSSFINNTAESGSAIYTDYESSYEIIGNTILNNVGSGVYIGGSLGTEGSVSASKFIEYKTLINFNRIYGNSPYGIFYELIRQFAEVSAASPLATINATLNWWGSNEGPNSVGADKTNLFADYYAPWIVMGLNPTQVTLNGGQTTQLIANFLYDNIGNYHDPANGHIPDGTPVTFTTTLGQVGSQIITKYTVNGVATALLRAWNAAGEPVWGTAFITAFTDGQTLRASATILEVSTANAKTIGMLNTGIPLAGLILGILALFGGFITPRRK